MLDRRNLLRVAAAATPFALCSPHRLSAQDDKPNFDIAGSEQTDPKGVEIVWSKDWEQQDIELMTFEPIPGSRSFTVLDWVNPPSSLEPQRIVIQAEAIEDSVSGQDLVDGMVDTYPELNGYAPGTVITSRNVTHGGAWFSFGAGEDSFVPGVIGLFLFYTPPREGDPLIRVFFNMPGGDNRTPEHLEFIDSSISLNGDWLLGMDELGNYWDALENSAGFDIA